MPNDEVNDARENDARREEAAAEATRADRLLGLQPDSLPLTENRARYLADLAGIDVKEIAGRTIAEVHDVLRWRLDPQLFLFRRICGQVVRRDPVTGELQPVPNATVHVEDTDCGYLSYFPRLSPYAWLLPFNCRREEIATVRTDSCGRFCVFLPFWDVDRILRWRRRWICDWVFQRPLVRDLVELQPERVPGPPIPDPGPLTRLQPAALDRLRDLGADTMARRLESARDASLRGERPAPLQEALDEPLFRGPVPPPRPNDEDEKSLAEVLAGARRGLPERIDLRQLRGPFLRCRQVLVPVWQIVLDVPDVTFRVTQDVDGDGDEEVIYSEGFFDVRWNSGSIPDVTLEASPDALATPHCGPVKEIPCGNVPSIEAAGYLDLEPGYHDDGDGYGLRVNRPSASGDYPPPASIGSPGPTEANAPYAGNLNLHGCVRLEDATHYRIKSEYSPEPSAPFGPQTPLLGIVWTAPRQGPEAPIPFVPNADGWYPIVDAAILVHPNWLLPWNTATRPNGLYRLVLEIGRQTGGNIVSVDESAPRLFRVDNTAPEVSFLEVRWRLSSVSGPWTDLNSTVVLPAPPDACPVIERPTGQSIDLRVVWSAAATHLRDAQLGQSGCSAAGGLVSLDGGVEAYRHWHTGPTDNNVTQANHFRLPGTHPPGCYSLSVYAASRAFNPQDFDAASTFDWWVNQAFRDSRTARAISVVNV